MEAIKRIGRIGSRVAASVNCPILARTCGDQTPASTRLEMRPCWNNQLEESASADVRTRSPDFAPTERRMPPRRNPTAGVMWNRQPSRSLSRSSIVRKVGVDPMPEASLGKRVATSLAVSSERPDFACHAPHDAGKQLSKIDRRGSGRIPLTSLCGRWNMYN